MRNIRNGHRHGRDRRLFAAIASLFYLAQARKEKKVLLYMGLTNWMRITIEYMPPYTEGHDVTVRVIDEPHLRPFDERSKKD